MKSAFNIIDKEKYLDCGIKGEECLLFYIHQKSAFSLRTYIFKF